MTSQSPLIEEKAVEYMSRLPVISARDLLKILHKIGYDVDHQTGSHIILLNRITLTGD